MAITPAKLNHQEMLAQVASSSTAPPADASRVPRVTMVLALGERVPVRGSLEELLEELVGDVGPARMGGHEHARRVRHARTELRPEGAAQRDGLSAPDASCAVSSACPPINVPSTNTIGNVGKPAHSLIARRGFHCER